MSRISRARRFACSDQAVETSALQRFEILSSGGHYPAGLLALLSDVVDLIALLN